jgi:hypothetical protein
MECALVLGFSRYPGLTKEFKTSFVLKYQYVSFLSNKSEAFFSKRGEFSFNTAYFDSPYYFDGTYNTVALVWAIGDKTSEEAEKDTGAFA